MILEQAIFIFHFLILLLIKEDAHICDASFDNGVSLFAVFDGHGGLECAKFCEKYFPEKLRE